MLAGLTDKLVSPEAVAVAVRAYAEETNRQNHERRAQGEADSRTLEEIERGIKGIMDARITPRVVPSGPAALFVRQSGVASGLRCVGAVLRKNVGLAFARVSAYLRTDLDRHDISAKVGEARIFATLHEALAAVRADGSLAGPDGTKAR